MQVPCTRYRPLRQSVPPASLAGTSPAGHYLHCLYALQRVVEEPGISEFQLRRETGLENYEISRGCKFLAVSGLIKIGRAVEDRRVRVLRPTSRGEKIRGQVLSKAAKQLQKGLSIDDGFHGVGTNRRLMEATESFQMGNRTLLGLTQLSFFDTNPTEMNG
jgi:hypothetical protein